MSVRHLEVLAELGATVPKDARILDFGCGNGDTVRALHSEGYANAEGYEVEFEGVSMLETPQSYITKGSQFDLRLPYPDNHFDLVISDQVFEHVQDQVATLKELQRVMKPGAHALHTFPARYRPWKEAHIDVPFGSVFIHRWYYKLWALLGKRNVFQKGWSADAVADDNTYFMVAGCRYVPNSCYRVIARKLGMGFAIATQAYFDSHSGRLRKLGKANRILPLIGWLFSQLHLRAIHLVKRT